MQTGIYSWDFLHVITTLSEYISNYIVPESDGLFTQIPIPVRITFAVSNCSTYHRVESIFYPKNENYIMLQVSSSKPKSCYYQIDRSLLLREV